MFRIRIRGGGRGRRGVLGVSERGGVRVIGKYAGIFGGSGDVGGLAGESMTGWLGIIGRRDGCGDGLPLFRMGWVMARADERSRRVVELWGRMRGMLRVRSGGEGVCGGGKDNGGDVG